MNWKETQSSIQRIINFVQLNIQAFKTRIYLIRSLLSLAESELKITLGSLH